MSDGTELGIGNNQTVDEINAMVLGQPITIEALKAAGFETNDDDRWLSWCNDSPRYISVLPLHLGGFVIYLKENFGNEVRVFPTNMAQIETLKELLTPK